MTNVDRLVPTDQKPNAPSEQPKPVENPAPKAEAPETDAKK